jgi:UTP--glucose-1-phosphate uridylyltransferase
MQLMKRAPLGSKNLSLSPREAKARLKIISMKLHSLSKRYAKKGKDELLEILQSTNMESGAIAYIRQHKALGLGHAVWCARRLISNEPFAVILPDDVIAAEKPCLQQMVEAYEENPGCMVAAMEVPQSQTSAYGILDVAEDMGARVSVKGMVEKPDVDKAPSNLAVIGRYILTPDVLRNLNKKKSGAGGEIQLTDGIADEIQEGRPVYGYRFQGQRFDCGSKSGFLQATVSFGLDRPELRDDLMGYLQHVVNDTRKAAE